MKRADIPSTIFGAAFFLTLALMALVIAPAVVLACGYETWRDSRRRRDP